MQKHLIPKFIVSLLLAATVSSAAADDERFEIEGYLNFVSDYRFRSISLTDRKPALQGSLSLIDRSGLYLGAWGSGVEVGGSEVDAYIGYAQRFISGMEVDIGYTFFHYTANDTDDFQELHARIGYSADWFGSISLRYALSDDFRNSSGKSGYYSADFSKTNRVNQSTKAGFRAGVGYQAVEDNLRFGFEDYFEWQAGIWVDWKDIRLGLDYVGNNLDNAQCSATRHCEPGAVVSIGKGL